MNISKYHLRIFLESTCNFRCVYCNPDAEREDSKVVNDLEVKEILSIGYDLGIERVHYSGGEPTLRKGLPEIISHAQVLGFKEQVITTNGVLLDRYFDDYVNAGLSRANISIDSLDQATFHKLTGRDNLENVLSAIRKSAQHFSRTKINVVVMKENLNELSAFIDFAERYEGKVVPRFIELQTNQPVFYKKDDPINEQHVNQLEILEALGAIGKIEPILVSGENPNCQYYKLDNSSVVFGIIANHSRGYPCGDCHKIRISPQGYMGVCINAEGINVKGSSWEEKKKAMEISLQRREQLDSVLPNRKHLSTTYGFWRWGDVSKEVSGNQAEVNIKAITLSQEV